VAGFRRDDPADAYLPDAESLLGAALLAQGKYTEAEPLLTAGYRGLERLLTTIPPRARFAVIEALNRLVVLYRRWDRPEQAAQLASERARLLPNVGPLPSRSLEEYGKALFDSRAYAEAEPPLRESLTIREKVQPDAWNTFNTQSMLGGAILGQKKYAEAEPLLLKGYQGMKQREKTIPPAGRDRLPEAVDRLVELYEATNRPTEAKKWRAERAKYPTVAPMPREVRR
jgi:TolA-binding protein